MEDRKMLRKQGHIFCDIPLIFQECRCHLQKKGEQTFCSSHRLKLLVKTNYATTQPGFQTNYWIIYRNCSYHRHHNLAFLSSAKKCLIKMDLIVFGVIHGCQFL